MTHSQNELKSILEQQHHEESIRLDSMQCQFQTRVEHIARAAIEIRNQKEKLEAIEEGLRLLDAQDGKKEERKS